MKPSLKRHILAVAAVLLVYAACFAVLMWRCAYSLCALECRSTFFYSSDFIASLLPEYMGAGRVCAAWLQQWFVSPLAACAIVAAMLTLTAVGIAMLIPRRLAFLLPLSLLPSALLVVLHGSATYMMLGTVAVTVAVVCLGGVHKVRAPWLRMSLALILTVALMYGFGPVALLFAAGIIIMYPRQWALWLSPVVALSMAVVIVRSGGCQDYSRALTHKAYFVPWLGTDRDAIWSLASADEHYAYMMYLARNGQWHSMIEALQTVDVDDTRMHNFLCLALAESRQIDKTLFSYPCRGRQSICDMQYASPDHYMLLSDIFYSMGHVSLAQKYAFEANEGMGNYSPYMLQRLADIALINGQDALAQKYLSMLASTTFYRDWAAQRLSLLYHHDAVAEHEELGAKQRCVYPSDNLAGYFGLEHDLENILQSNPSHDITLHYLGAMYMLQRDVPALMRLIDTYYGTAALEYPLPKHFQEALAVATLATDERVDLKYGVHPTVVQNCRDFWQKHQHRPATFWQYLRSKK